MKENIDESRCHRAAAVKMRVANGSQENDDTPDSKLQGGKKEQYGNEPLKHQLGKKEPTKSHHVLLCPTTLLFKSGILVTIVDKACCHSGCS